MKSKWYGEDTRIGILGGGQLGRMLLQEAINLNIHLHCLDPDENAPCSKIAHSFTVGEPITFTFENTSLSKTITQGFQQPDKVIVSPIQPRLFKNQVIEHFTCYPNPFDTKITITSPTNFNQTVFVKIINELGSLIHEEKMDSNSLVVDLSTITIGRYHVIIANESGEIIESFSAVKFK